MDLVELPKAEVLCYHYLLRNSAQHNLPPLPVPTPRLLFADHCPSTNNALCIMERVTHTLGDQTKPDSLAQVKATMSCLASLHSHFWGGASGRHPEAKRLNDAANPICLIAGLKMKINIKSMLTLLQKENGYSPSPPLVAALKNLVPDNMLVLLRWCVDHPLNTVCHGDPRTDNVYFIGDPAAGTLTAGLFDFALAINAPCFYDISWSLGNLRKDFFDEHHDELLKFYWSELMDKLAKVYGAETAKKADYELFLVGYAMSQAVCISKNTIAYEVRSGEEQSDELEKARLREFNVQC